MMCFMCITSHKKSRCIYYNLTKALNTSSGDCTAILHSPSAYGARSDRLRHLSVYAYCTKILTLVSLRTIKCHPKFSLVEGVLSYILFTRTLSSSTLGRSVNAVWFYFIVIIMAPRLIYLVSSTTISQQSQHARCYCLTVFTLKERSQVK